MLILSPTPFAHRYGRFADWNVSCDSTQDSVSNTINRTAANEQDSDRLLDVLQPTTGHIFAYIENSEFGRHYG